VVNEVLGRGMSEDVRNVPGFVGEFFFSLGGFDEPGKISSEYVWNIRCIYIQVQKVYVLYLFLGNRRIFLKKFLGGRRGIEEYLGRVWKQGGLQKMRRLAG
jgi:hypothetical protein